MDHRHTVDRLIEIFDDRLRSYQGDALVGLDHDRSFPGRIEVDELVTLFPWVFAHQLMADALLCENEPDLARKRAERELEELPHGGAALAAVSCQSTVIASYRCG